MAVPGFYWVIEGALAGSGRPSSAGPSSAAPAALESDLRWLADHNLRAILSLTEEPLPSEAMRRFGMTALHLPVRDLTAPTPEQFTRALEFIDNSQAQGAATLVHCLMGQGRAGTVLAAYLVRAGASAEGAIQRIRAICPGAISMPEQQRAIAAFAYRRDWIV